MELRWYVIIDVISHGLLIAGAVKENRFFLLPSMIINILINIVLWIVVLIAIFGGSLLSSILSAIPGAAMAIPSQHLELHTNIAAESTIGAVKGIGGAILVVIISLFVLLAVIHLLITKVICDHFVELREEEQRGRTQQQQLPMFVSSNTFVSQPVSPTVLANVRAPDANSPVPIEPAAIYPTDISDYTHK